MNNLSRSPSKKNDSSDSKSNTPSFLSSSHSSFDREIENDIENERSLEIGDAIDKELNLIAYQNTNQLLNLIRPEAHHQSPLLNYSVSPDRPSTGIPLFVYHCLLFFF